MAEACEEADRRVPCHRGLSSPSFISPMTPGHGTVPPTDRVRSPCLVNFQKYLHRHTQERFSNVMHFSGYKLPITGGGTFQEAGLAFPARPSSLLLSTHRDFCHTSSSTLF